ncbi:MAG: hypothetical protein ACR2NP_21640 [Pirellulaceae bacterium]
MIRIQVLLLVLAGHVTSAYAQTSDIDERSTEIIEACVDAMGTDMRLRGIDTLTLRGTTRVVQHEESGEEILIIVGGQDQFHMKHGEGEIFSTFDGPDGWTGIEGQPPRRLDASQLALIREFFPLPNVVASWNSFPGTVRFEGAAEFAGKPAWKVEFTYDQGDHKFTRYFDQESKLLVFQKHDGAGSAFGYKLINDVEILSKVEIFDGPGADPGEVYQVFEIDEINVNDPLPVEVFQMPEALKDVDTDQQQDQSDKRE